MAYQQARGWECSNTSYTRQDLDFLVAQEVTSPEMANMRVYETHLIIRTTMRGTAIVARRGIQLTNITTMPSGRAIAADFRRMG